jgi:hypothetical protein
VAWYWVSVIVCIAWIWISNIVCIAYQWIYVLIINWACIAICGIKRMLARNEISYEMSECIYDWDVKYRIEDIKCNLNITLRIKFERDPDVTDTELQNAINIWEPAIENTWTGQHRITLDDGDCECAQYGVNLDMQIVENNEHHTVRVARGPGRSNMTNWHHDDSGGVASHEVGHMLGYADEYADAGCPNRPVTNDNSIMETTTGTPRPRHYKNFADWITLRTCCDYVVS